MRAHDREAVLGALLEARVPAVPVNDAADLIADPHVAARGSLEHIRGTRAPDLGADRDAVLKEWLA